MDSERLWYLVQVVARPGRGVVACHVSLHFKAVYCFFAAIADDFISHLKLVFGAICCLLKIVLAKIFNPGRIKAVGVTTADRIPNLTGAKNRISCFPLLTFASNYVETSLTLFLGRFNKLMPYNFQCWMLSCCLAPLAFQ